MIIIAGWNTTIAAELRKLLPEDEEAVRGDPVKPDIWYGAERYLFATGLLRAKRRAQQTKAEAKEGLEVNAAAVMRTIDKILAQNPIARIVVIGSESAYRGSYDDTYAEAKLLLHSYVETKRLHTAAQQLVCISPTIIRDAGMTMRRHDLDVVDSRASSHPKGRFLESVEVARLIKYLLYEDDGYISGTVIRMHGGQA